MCLFMTKNVYKFSLREMGSLEWTNKYRMAYHNFQKKMTRLNVNDEYNLSMGGANVADQFCNQYYFGHCLRNYKW